MFALRRFFLRDELWSSRFRLSSKLSAVQQSPALVVFWLSLTEDCFHGKSLVSASVEGGGLGGVLLFDVFVVVQIVLGKEVT